MINYTYLNNFWLITLREKCPYLEFFWSVFSRSQTEYGEILRISPYSVQIRENTDQKNSDYGHLSHSVTNYYLFLINRCTFFPAMEIKS